MGGEAVSLGPFKGGMHNASGNGDFIADDELLELTNLEVDTDGSLVNRPAVNEFTYTTAGAKDGVRVLGTYLPADGRRFLVIMNNGSLKLIDLATNTNVVTSNAGLSGACVVQYANRLWIIPGPTDTAGNGGYFEALTATAPTFTTVAAIPRGGATFLYKERIWVVAGVAATTNTSRLSFSAIGDATSWPGINFIDVEPGNGEKLVYGLVLNNDVILFKQHSTYRFTYDTDPAKSILSKISSNIGAPAANCAVTYDNNNVYVMHDSSVYELFNYTFTRISDKIDMSQDSDLTLYAADIYGLSLYRDRLFARYYSHLYVYSLKTGTWSQWVTDRKFSRVTVLPTTDIGLDIAYAATATTAQTGKIFYFQDSRTLNVGTGESFTCSITTKMYEYTLPYAFKRLYNWGLTIATTGVTTCVATIPNSSRNPTWDELSTKTWDDLASTPWDVQGDIMFTNVVDSGQGGFAKKYYKLGQSFRFVRAFFTISSQAMPNNIADTSVRIFDITTFIKQGQRVAERVS